MNAYKDTTHTWPYCMQCSPKYFLQAPAAVGLHRLHDLAELFQCSGHTEAVGVLEARPFVLYTGCPDDFPWDL